MMHLYQDGKAPACGIGGCEVEFDVTHIIQKHTL